MHTLYECVEGFGNINLLKQVIKTITIYTPNSYVVSADQLKACLETWITSENPTEKMHFPFKKLREMPFWETYNYVNVIRLLDEVITYG